MPWVGSDAKLQGRWRINPYPSVTFSATGNSTVGRLAGKWMFRFSAACQGGGGKTKARRGWGAEQGCHATIGSDARALQ